MDSLPPPRVSPQLALVILNRGKPKDDVLEIGGAQAQSISRRWRGTMSVAYYHEPFAM